MCRFVRVAIPSPLARLFDYALPEDGLTPSPGARVLVPFGRQSLVAVVVELTDKTDVPADKIKAISGVLDSEALLPPDMLSLLLWAARYYVHPVGEVLNTAIPALWRRPEPVGLPATPRYRLREGADTGVISARASLQLKLAAALAEAGPDGLGNAALAELGSSWRNALNALIEQNLVDCRQELWRAPLTCPDLSPPELHDEQQTAVAAVEAARGGFAPFLLRGVTGSGKTEVYLRLIEKTVADGGQVLVMVPEISLTPQLLERFCRRLQTRLVTLHSGLRDAERATHWLAAARGEAQVVIGTRSSVFTPLPRLQLIVVDEEHDASFKQQDGFRYHARDLAMVRARNSAVPIVLGSATPSFESLFNVRQGRFTELRLTHRAGGAVAPKIGLLDVRRRGGRDGVSTLLRSEMERHLEAGGQVLVFINRRGYAPVLICDDCGETADCRRCDAHMTVHSASQRLRCHHCGAERPIPKVCESCGAESLEHVGQGSERIELALQEAFPDKRVIRIDRDTTRRKGALEAQLALATSGEADILVGTQMLAKGHHFPNVTLVGILDADRGLFGTDFRSLEQMGQLIVQVAGRAGREARQGEVLIQTRNPEHVLLKLLVSAGYDEFAEAALKEREDAELPPFSKVALVRAESAERDGGRHFLAYVADLIKPWREALQAEGHTVYVLGPVVAPMERVGGRFRYQLMFQSDEHRALNRLLASLRRLLETDKAARKIRWSLDIDPLDFF
ncbi:primosomal protein N' [Granulosicoccaceae sp. 1_MG-2023]|nr:primosomal protein N' [Granulosicoccaceae sp. 1_MG-2023]